MTMPETPRIRILRATAALASEFGYIGTTISKITKQTGMPTSSIYWYFGDKDHLMAEVIEHTFAEWTASLPQPGDIPQPPIPLGETLRTVLDASSLSFQQAPDFLRIGHMLLLETREVEAVARKRLVAIRSTLLDQTAAWLANFLPEGAPENLARDLARLIIASQDGLFLARQRGETWNSEYIVDLIVATAENAVAAIRPRAAEAPGA